MALDPSILSDLDALKAAGFDFNTGTTASERAAQARPAGFGAGASDPATNRPLAGRDFTKPGPALARSRAAAARSSVADTLTRARGRLALPAGARTIAGAAAKSAGTLGLIGPAAVAGGVGLAGGDLETAIRAATSPIEFLGRGIGQKVANMFLTPSERAAAEKFNVSAFEDFPGEPLSSTPATAPAATAAPVAPAGPAATDTPPAADQPATLQRIVNADGTTSYTNVPADVAAAKKTGASVSAVPGTATDEIGNTFAAPSALDKSRALSAFIRDRDYAGARNVAQTEDDLRLIDLKEQQFLNTNPRRARELRKEEQDFRAQQGATRVATVKAAADALKAGPQAVKNLAEARRITTLLNSLQGVPAEQRARLLAGIAPQSDKISIEPSLTGGEPTVIRVKAGSTIAESLPIIKRHPVGTIVEDAKGKKHVLQADGSLKAQR